MPTEIILHLGNFMEEDSLNALIQTQKRFASILTQQLYSRGLNLRVTRASIFRENPLFPDGDFTSRIFECASKWKSEFVTMQLLKMTGLTFSSISFKDEIDVSFGGIMLVMATAGNVKMVELLLKNYCDVNEESWDGRTALHWAILKKHEAVTRTLLKAGANPTHADENGVTPIMLQVEVSKSQSILNLLIESAQKSGNDIFGTNCDEETALHVGARHGNIAAIQLFLDLGADASKKDFLGYYPLLRAIKTMPGSLTRPIVQAMVEAFGEVSTPNNSGETPLHYAVNFSHGGWLVDFLIAAGADITARNALWRTPIHLAVIGRNSRMVIVMIQHGANPYYTPWISSSQMYGESPIQIISKEISWSLVTERFPLPPSLIQCKFEKVGCRILHIISHVPVVEAEHVQFVSNHLQSCHNGPPDSPGCGGQQSDFALALHALCLIPTKPGTRGTTYKMIRSIISSRASVLAKDTRGFTPLHYAARSGKKEVIKLFLFHGCNGYSTKYGGVEATALRFDNVVEELLIAGRAEDALIRDEDGVCGLDRWAMNSIYDHLNFVVVNRLLARARILACLGDCDETYWIHREPFSEERDES
ncbi:hypothetical protein GX51_07843 [Blastomyces parvus]|uniref:Uncharacterized protein n=1 Tax=Blastomyces parvus TaxID=2060905 RepID=A0A2B7WIN4_9EURO|nr:hypothetical protein GX51_07843 [Blastomyces parvus]